MKTIHDILVLVLGWEERFLLGFEKDLDLFEVKKVILLNFNVKTTDTLKNKVKVQDICNEKNIIYAEVDLNYNNSIGNWHSLSFTFKNYPHNQNILLDISTTPRETIWSILYHLIPNTRNLSFIYHKPESYDPNWLTKEPGKPRLLLNHSGIHKLNCPTALIIITGFEFERAKQLIYFFEPKVSRIGVQKGKQFNNIERNKELHQSLQEFPDVTEFEIDAYGADYGFTALNDQVSVLKNEYNIVLASLGPKPTAIAMYNAFVLHPEIALSYVPNKDFNINYSRGIGEFITGKILRDL